MVDKKERGGFEWQHIASIGPSGADVFWSDVTLNSKQEGTRRGKLLVL
jgi:hypothetical protein